MDIKTYFDRCVVVSLKRTPQRLEAFQKRLDACQWPFSEVLVQRAIDGRRCPPPPWWHNGNAAWGAKCSHAQAVEQALNDGVQRLLVLEDDAEFVDGFADKATAFVNALPADWELAYFGGQINHYNLKEHPPEKINPHVIRPFSVNRLHAYALTANGLKKVYRHLNRWNWQQGELVTGPKGHSHWQGGHHVDHHLEVLSRNRQIATYAPIEALTEDWLVKQSASYSEILGRHLPSRPFNKAGTPPLVIAVLGPYRGGTSAVAGALHHLGILMGHKFLNCNDSGKKASPKGCFEAQALFDICLACYPEPKFDAGCAYADRVKLLKRWASGRWGDGAVIGAKHPKLCLMVPEMMEAWPGCKFVIVRRDVTKSIDSLRKLGWWQPTIQPDALINRLIDTRDTALAAVDPNYLPGGSRHSIAYAAPHIDMSKRIFSIAYDDFIENPSSYLSRVAEFAGIEPTPEHYEKAMAQLDVSLNHHAHPCKE